MSEENNNVRKRNLKVYYGYYDNKWSITRHPVIRLRGNYLTFFGFKVGDAIEVSVGIGEIIIRKLAGKPP